MPRFSFFLPHSKETLAANSPLWHQRMPLRLDALLKDDGESVSHADYFRAARSFLESDSYKLITRAVSEQLGRDVKVQDIREIRIELVKHGQYYHPARIESLQFQKPLAFVLNVAVSESGRRLIKKEYRILKRLNAAPSLRPLHYLPQVYGFGRAFGPEGKKFDMFLGEWFEGYHEFHMAIDPADQKPKILVWDDTRGRFFLSRGQLQRLYAEAAKIMTSYYNLESFEQISAWHHGAGDFVVKIENDGLELKLVTVRQYAPIFEDPNDLQTVQTRPQPILQALMVFFLNLALRMRLDRLDGTGKMVWSDKAAVEATLIGFLEALSMKPDIAILPDSVLACFTAYLSSCTKADLLELSRAIVKRFNPKMPELPVIKENIDEHVETLYHIMGQFFKKLQDKV
jgi:hypothetical protein